MKNITIMKESISEYVKRNEQELFELLFELLRIPSISAKSEHHDDMWRCAETWKKFLLAAGADKAEVMSTSGNPVVYAEKLLDPSLPTIMIYGRYDVMPAEP